MRYEINSLSETEDLATTFAETLNGNEIILLNGELGAGKTTFTKSLAKALGVTDVVTSPTFAFMREYYGKFKISHYDMYRAENQDELFELGIYDNLTEQGIAVIEWNKFDVFPPDKQVINIDIIKTGDNSRIFDIKNSNSAD